MLERKGILVPVFLVAQALFAHWLAGSEHLPQAPDLSTMPTQLGDWTQISENGIAEDVGRELGADRLTDRNYFRRATNSSANLFVAWFQSQRGGASQPHSPKVCLPGAGWTPEAISDVTIDTTAGAITVNRYVVSKGQQRAIVLYWYRTPRRVVAGEWSAKFWLVADALRDQRTDTSMVRVLTWVQGTADNQATTEALGFAREVYPVLRQQLPR
jgi:EpsI family protein